MPSLAISALLLVSISHTADASDWAQWRGPNRDAKSQETGLLDTWPEDGPPPYLEGNGGRRRIFECRSSQRSHLHNG